MYDQGAVLRAAAADLDGVAQRLAVARFAENAVVEGLAVLRRPVEQLRRAVDGDALLVAGDQERDRAFWLAAVGGEIVQRGGDAGSDPALHVDGAASIKDAVGNLACERRMRPRCLVAGRHHVGMAGEHQVRRSGADAGVEILHVGRAGFGEGHAVGGEARGLQQCFQIAERAAFRGCHGGTAQQVLRDGDRIGCGHAPALPGRTGHRQ